MGCYNTSCPTPFYIRLIDRYLITTKQFILLPGYFLRVFGPLKVFAIHQKSKDDIYFPVVLLLRNAPWMGNNNNLGYPSQTERCEASIPLTVKKLAL
jgi:hypothetical protein